MTVTLKQVEVFIRKKAKLRHSVSTDMAAWRIVKEADLQSCVYYHLRRFLKGDKRWRVFSEKHSRQTEHFIDLLVCENKPTDGSRTFKPRIAIELKWNRDHISKKDRKSLNLAIKTLRIKKAYFINATYNPIKEYQKMKKVKEEKFKLFELVVGLPPKVNREEWRIIRRRIKALENLSGSKAIRNVSQPA